MNIKDIVAKIAKGDKPTDAELSALEGALLPEEADAKAAAARRKAEDEARTLKEKVSALEAEKKAAEEAQRKREEEGQTATQKMEKQLADLSKKFTALEAAKAESDKAAAALQRAQAVDQIRVKAGITFRDGIDPAITSSAFSNALKDVEDLANADAVKAAVKAFVGANAGLINSEGHGSGLKGGPKVSYTQDNPYSLKTLNLTKQIDLEKNNPQLAAELKAAAQTE